MNYLITITGGSASGKTTVAQKIKSEVKNSIVLRLDDYYKKNVENLSYDQLSKKNYDHPFAFDFDLLIENLIDLINDKPIEKPIYDFSIHDRLELTEKIIPKKIIILEGILVLDNAKIRELSNIKLFVDTDPDTRVIRRIQRDTIERGRSLQSVVLAYESNVKPMHAQFIEPTKKFADLIIPNGGKNKIVIEFLKNHLKTMTNIENLF